MATLVARRRTDGTTGYRVQWRLGGGDGPWQSETFEDRRAAAKFQSQVEANSHAWPEGWVKGWGFHPAPAPTVEVPEHALLEFGVAYVRRLTSTGPDTQSRYIRQLRALVVWLQDVKSIPPTLENVTADDDRDWINARRRAGASPKTITNYHGLLAAVFADAVRKGLVARNPCAGVKLPRRDDDIDDDESKSFLTEAEFRLLLGCVDEDARDLLIAAVGTGLRWGELTALTVRDLDLAAAVPTLKVRRTWKHNGGADFELAGHGRFYLGTPKTKESRRVVSLAPTVVQALHRQTAGLGHADLVFTAPRGGRLDHAHWFESRWRPAVHAARDAGLKRSPRFHDLRHTHAAWLISAGVPLPVVQKRLGHKSIQITVDVYGGVLFQTHQVADLAVEQALGGQQIVTVAGGASAELAAAELLNDDQIA